MVACPQQLSTVQRTMCFTKYPANKNNNLHLRSTGKKITLGYDLVFDFPVYGVVLMPTEHKSK